MDVWDAIGDLPDLPKENADVTASWANLKALDERVRHFARLDKSYRAQKMKQLKDITIPAMKDTFKTARTDNSNEIAGKWAIVQSKIQEMHALSNQMIGGQEYKDNQSEIYKAMRVHEYWEKTVQKKIEEYEEHVRSLEKVLNDWAIFDTQPNYDEN
ncbi:hypothetical protein EAE99_008914 [Botrytis elliptica]|nr:hypothetical protein EAE99_008914 [Botrytis elliptica]